LSKETKKNDRGWKATKLNSAWMMAPSPERRRIHWPRRNHRFAFSTTAEGNSRQHLQQQGELGVRTTLPPNALFWCAAEGITGQPLSHSLKHARQAIVWM
jgi:hypothetical protein